MMKKLLLGLWLLGLTYPCMAKDWNGIVPLKSTRADVERRLGQPKDDLDGRYYFVDEIVTIQYSGFKCGEVPRIEGWPVSPVRWNVKPDVVTSIGVKLRRAVPLSSLSVDLSKFKRTSRGHLTSIFYYHNETEGFTIEAFEEEGKEMIRGFIYEPGAGNEALLCPAKKN